MGQSRKPHAVIDRGWVTEVVYSRALSREPALGYHHQWCLSLEAATHGLVTHFLDPTLAVLERRWVEQPNVTREQWLRVIDEYRKWLDEEAWFWHGYLHQVVKVTEPDLSDMSESAEAMEAVSEEAHLRESWGAPVPKLLLVGERPNPNKVCANANYVRPLMPRNAGEGGAYLFRALGSVGLCPHEVHLCNAYRSDSQPEKVRHLWEKLMRPPIVTLGKVADEALLDRDLPHGAVDHPQYKRRFESGLEELYGLEIMDAGNLNRTTSN